MTTRDDFDATLPVAEVLERLGVPYFIGGSVASSVHGVGRSTMDVDIVAQLEFRHASALVQALQKDFYIDEEMIRSAIRTRNSFNVIHFELQHKVDVFVDKQRPFDRAAWTRIQHAAPFEASDREFPIASPEDVILSKLDWCRISPSEKQMKDVEGVIKVQGDLLDRAYLQRWAAELGVSDLLEKACRECSL